MTEFDNLILIDDRKLKSELNKTIHNPSFIPDIGDRIKLGTEYPKVGYRHFDYDARTVFLYMR